MRLLGYDLYLIELKLDGGLAAEHRDNHVHRVLIDLNGLHSAGEGAQRTIQNTDGIAHSVVDDDLLLFHAHGVDFLFGQRNGVIAGCTDEAGHAADVLDDMPGVVRVDHLDKHITGVDLALIGLADTGFGDLGDGLCGDGNSQNLILKLAALHSLFNGGLHRVLVSGIGMEYIPLSRLSHGVPLTGPGR